MANRRNTGFELCFDSMTDLITNLAGGLILLVLLLLGVTREIRSAPADPDERNGADPKSLAPLRTRINLLRSEIAAVEQNLKNLEAKLPQLRRQVQELIDRAGQVHPPKEQQNAKDEEKEAKTVEFRPPFSRESQKDTNAAFVCQENRIYLFDLAAFESALKQKNPQKGEKVQLASGDYDVLIKDLVLVLVGNQIGRAPLGELILKAGHRGEALEQIHNPQSVFQVRLKQLDPAKNTLQFQVYPDSFQAFREARAIAWKLEFGLNWSPLEAGSNVKVGHGRVREL